VASSFGWRISTGRTRFVNLGGEYRPDERGLRIWVANIDRTNAVRPYGWIWIACIDRDERGLDERGVDERGSSLRIFAIEGQCLLQG
jgi:hypothetical protein